MSPELSDEQETSYPNYPPEIFWAFHEDRQRQTNVKHRIFTGDHAQSTNEPTESRRLKDASFMKRLKMLDEGIVQPSESPWSSPIVLSLLKSGVEFHWGPERGGKHLTVLRKHTSDPVLGMYDERASTEIHTSGTVSELS
ncbi:hypothetical protein TNCV_978851 [Trichonephila clavipes]|nr:hypothetical protein TNCV_978851 [Trichonephila clavipes]